MVRGIGTVDIIKGCIYCDGFEINLDNGSYEYTGEIKRKKKTDDSIIYSEPVKSLKKLINYWSKNEERIKVNIDVIYVDGQEFSKEGIWSFKGL